MSASDPTTEQPNSKLMGDWKRVDALNVLKEIAAGIKENTTITREAWHAIVTGQQAAPPLNEGDFQEIDLCANDAEDEFIEPHIRLKKLLPVAQERHLTSKEPIALIMGGAIYHIGLKVEDITGIVAKCR